MVGTFTHFVGRSAELGAIDGVLDALDAGGPAALAIVGEPGIGKTRLLAELAARADERRHLTLTGTASELERDVPFSLFVDALDEYVRSLDPGLFTPLGGDVLGALAQVVPGLPGAATPPSQAGTYERYRIHRAVTLLLERLAAHRPLVLVLDDLHWADSGSFELVTALLRHTPAAPVLLAVAMRPRLVPEPVAAAIERARRSGGLTSIDLDPLTLDDARTLLDGSDDVAATEALYTESGGNPFYLEQLARSLDRDGRASSSSGEEQTLAGIQVPAAVAAALAEELALVSAGGRLVLQGAAVAGNQFEPELAAAAAGTSEGAALEALDELLGSDLVRPTDVPRRFRFRHPLVRRAAYEATPGGWRLAAHERCAAALAVRGSSVAARAHHVELSARQGDEDAVALLRAAGEEAAQRAPTTAARWFEGALRLLPADAVEERVELLLARAGALAATGHFEESHAALVESLRIVPDDAVALRVRLVVKCAEVENQLGRAVQARSRLEDTLETLEGRDSPEAAALMIELAISALFEGEFEGMARWADAAIATADPLRDSTVTATALAVEAAGAAMAASPIAGKAKRDEAARLVDALSDDELATRLAGPTYLALAEMYLDHYEDSLRHAARALAISRATGQGDLLAPITAMLGSGLWVRGRMAEAKEVLSGAVEAARLMDNAQSLCWTLFNYAYGLVAAGDIELALAIGQESHELAQTLDPGPIAGHAGSAFALALSESGAPARAAEVLVSAAGGEEMPMIGGAWRVRNLELLTRCRLATGNRAEAERAAETARACAAEVGLPMAHAMAALARAALELDVDDAASAAGLARDAVVMLESVGDSFDAARARVVAGRALGRAGDNDGAAAELERAAAAFASFGSPRYQAEAEQELRKIGRRVYRRSTTGTAPDGVEAMTERELQLARLVVDRKTNPQIAAELYLSPKTVEAHLRNIFRKVGVSSRVELARAVEHADEEQRDTSELPLV